jgi:hypothetical protein
MSLFTFVLEYDGGSYIRQASAPSLAEAIVSWAAQMKRVPIGRKKERYDIAEAIKSDQPVPLRGLTNAYCSFFDIDHSPALLNIVKTECLESDLIFDNIPVDEYPAGN